MCRPAHAKSDSLEHPLHAIPRHRREFLALARALLHSEQTADAHGRVLLTAFQTKPAARRLNALAARTVSWTSTCPPPRLRELVRKLRADQLLHRVVERHGLLQLPLVASAARMRPFSGASSRVVLESARELADWLRLDPEHLLWFADLHDWNASRDVPLLSHYTTRILAKPYGAIRLLEIPKQRLRSMQRQILDEILKPISLHPAVHGFCKGRSILSFASPHVAREAVLRLDLQNFFPSISGPRVQALFRTLGYPEPVADLLGGLCTTTTPRRILRNTGLALSAEELQRAHVLYARPHLPQGAPTSPALSNLCAFRLDRRIAGLAKAAGVTYTRYADDLAFSGDATFAQGADRFARHVFGILSDEGFSPHYRKTRLMRPSVRQHLAGLTVNVRPNLPRSDWDLLEAILTNCVRYGPETQNRDQHPDFRRHLEGRVAFASMIHASRGARLRALFEKIAWS